MRHVRNQRNSEKQSRLIYLIKRIIDHLLLIVTGPIKEMVQKWRRQKAERKY